MSHKNARIAHDAPEFELSCEESILDQIERGRKKGNLKAESACLLSLLVRNWFYSGGQKEMDEVNNQLDFLAFSQCETISDDDTALTLEEERVARGPLSPKAEEFLTKISSFKPTDRSAPVPIKCSC